MTVNLTKINLTKVSLEQAEYYSSFQKIVVSQRLKGLKIDLDVIRDTIPKMEKEIERLKNELMSKLSGSYGEYSPEGYDPINIDSPKQLISKLADLGYNLPKSKKGNDSANGKWLDQNKDDPLLSLIIEYRTTKKIMNDFFIKPLEMQKYTCPGALERGDRYGRLFPELNILGASSTGRMSSSNINIQNIPQRNIKWGKICRSMFVPENSINKWYKLDYSSQENRIGIHFANQMKASGIYKFVNAFKEDPLLDIHKMTYANMFNIKYKDVTKEQKNFIKPINLGLGYGMQKWSLSKNIGKSIEQTEEILYQYKKTNPYIFELMEFCKQKYIQQGFILSLDKRKLYRDIPKEGRPPDYKASNKKIQGSAGDMIYAAYKKAYEEGLDIKILVHDEINIEGAIDNARKLKYIMENTHKLSIPMIVEVSEGNTWGDQKKIELSTEEVDYDNRK